MIEKLNLREVENGAHGAQSTVVEGASLKAHYHPGGFAAVCFCFEKALLFHGAIWLVKGLEPRLTRRVFKPTMIFNSVFLYSDGSWKFSGDISGKPWFTWKKVFMILHYKRSRIWRRAGRFTGEFRDIRRFERLHCFVSLCNEFLSCYKISELGVTRWPSHLYMQRSVLPQERPRILSTQASGEKLICKM